MREGQAFCGQDNIVAGVGLFPHTQIKNPLGSGIRTRVYFETTVPFFLFQNRNVRRFDPDLATFAPTFPPINLLGGGPAPLTQLRKEATVALVGSPFWLLLAPAPIQRSYAAPGLGWVHDLLPGEAIAMNGTVSSFVILTYYWIEQPL